MKAPAAYTLMTLLALASLASAEPPEVPYRTLTSGNADASVRPGGFALRGPADLELLPLSARDKAPLRHVLKHTDWATRTVLVVVGPATTSTVQIKRIEERVGSGSSQLRVLATHSPPGSTTTSPYRVLSVARSRANNVAFDLSLRELPQLRVRGRVEVRGTRVVVRQPSDRVGPAQVEFSGKWATTLKRFARHYVVVAGRFEQRESIAPLRFQPSRLVSPRFQSVQGRARAHRKRRPIGKGWRIEPTLELGMETLRISGPLRIVLQRSAVGQQITGEGWVFRGEGVPGAYVLLTKLNARVIYPTPLRGAWGESKGTLPKGTLVTVSKVNHDPDHEWAFQHARVETAGGKKGAVDTRYLSAHSPLPQASAVHTKILSGYSPPESPQRGGILQGLDKAGLKKRGQAFKKEMARFKAEYHEAFKATTPRKKP